MPAEKDGRRLGRGLDALIKRSQSDSPPKPTGKEMPDDLVEIGLIRPNPYQPRRDFSKRELEELQSSLATSGLLQPITVRPSPGGTGFELVAGERRLRAATALGWKKIPALIRKIDDREALAHALVENLQRSDLNPIEEADGYKRLVDEFALTHSQVADLVGKDRSTVANLLRVLNLPDSVRMLVRAGELGLGHARALLPLNDPGQISAFAKDVVSRGLSVRQTEALVRANANSKPATKSRIAKKLTQDAHVTAIEQRLRRRLQTDVAIRLAGTERGSISITFYSADDLERILELVGVPASETE